MADEVKKASLKVWGPIAIFAIIAILAFTIIFKSDILSIEPPETAQSLTPLSVEEKEAILGNLSDAPEPLSQAEKGTTIEELGSSPARPEMPAPARAAQSERYHGVADSSDPNIEAKLRILQSLNAQ